MIDEMKSSLLMYYLTSTHSGFLVVFDKSATTGSRATLTLSGGLANALISARSLDVTPDSAF